MRYIHQGGFVFPFCVSLFVCCRITQKKITHAIFLILLWLVHVIARRTVLQLGEGRIMLRNIAEVCALLCAVMFYLWRFCIHKQVVNILAGKLRVATNFVQFFVVYSLVFSDAVSFYKKIYSEYIFLNRRNNSAALPRRAALEMLQSHWTQHCWSCLISLSLGLLMIDWLLKC